MNGTAPVLRPALVLLALLAFAGPAPAQRGVPTPELRLDPPSQPETLRPTAATDGNRRFAVAWRTVGATGQGIAGTLLDTVEGTRVNFKAPGTALQVSRAAVVVPHSAEIQALVAWGELRDPTTGCVVVRAFDEHGVLHDPAALDCFPATAVPQVALAEIPPGGFALAWSQPVGPATAPTAVFLRLFDAGGPLFGEGTRVWPFGRGVQSAPQLARDAAGRLLVTWQQTGLDGSPRLMARRFDAGPTVVGLGPAVQLDTGTFFSARPRLAGAADGRFVVAWEESLGDKGVVHARVFDRAGSLRRALGHPFSGHPVLGVDRPDVAMDSRGNVAVAWDGINLNDDHDRGVIAFLFNDAGRREGTLGLSGESTRGRQASPAVALADTGRLLLAWESQRPGQETEIHARFFFIPGDDDVCVYRDDVFRCLEERQIRFGAGVAAGDQPFLADIDGDGDDDPCLRRADAFYCDPMHGTGTDAALFFHFGLPTDVPLMGDLDGDGREDPCVRRRRSWLCDTAHDGGEAESGLVFGRAADQPLLGDVDGDGDDDPCVFRAAAAALLCDTTHDGVQDLTIGLANLLTVGTPPLLLGDVDGDGRDDPCIRRGDALWCDSTRAGIPVRHGDEPLLPGDIVVLGDIDNF